MEHNIHPQQPSTKKGRYFQCRHKTLCAWRKWAEELGISKSHAYKVIHKLNAELREKGYLTPSPGGSIGTFSWRSFAMARRERRANHGSL